jgi:hypothetical protein
MTLMSLRFFLIILAAIHCGCGTPDANPTIATEVPVVDEQLLEASVLELTAMGEEFADETQSAPRAYLHELGTWPTEFAELARFAEHKALPFSKERYTAMTFTVLTTGDLRIHWTTTSAEGTTTLTKNGGWSSHFLKRGSSQKAPVEDLSTPSSVEKMQTLD